MAISVGGRIVLNIAGEPVLPALPQESVLAGFGVLFEGSADKDGGIGCFGF
jgi:hypothetical protein